MQHHSAPTRLLDWTCSPFVAAYIAVEDQNNDAKIWCCDRWRLDEVMQKRFARGRFLSDIFPEGENYEDANQKKDIFFLDALEYSQRHHIQQGCFMMCKDPLADIATILRSAGCLHEYVIPQSEKYQFLHRLRAMNIGNHSLFPEIDGLGRSVRDWVRCQVSLKE